MARKTNDDAFVERKLDEKRDRPRSRRVVRIRLDADGNAEFQNLSDEEKTAVLAGMAGDPEANRFFSELLKQTGPLTITPEHVGMALDMLGWLEAVVIPAAVKIKTKGLIKIPPEIALRCFSYSQDTKEKICPDGAAWANATLPEHIKKWLVEVGPGAKFFSSIALLTIAQTQAAIAMTIMKDGGPTVEASSPPGQTAGQTTAPPSTAPDSSGLPSFEQPINGRERNTTATPEPVTESTDESGWANDV